MDNLIKIYLEMYSKLPLEIRYLIMNGLSPIEAFRIQQFNLFPELKDWSYWRRKSEEVFQAPRDYFDLGLKRDVSGVYRY